MKPTMGIIAPNNGRSKVLELFGASIQRIRTQLDTYIPVCIISGEEDLDICNKYHLTHIKQRNNPVSEKFNRGMVWARDMGITNVLISGSDDIFSTDTIKRIIEEIDKGYDVVGIDNIYFYAGDGINRGKMCHLVGKRILGVGKTISDRILTQVNWRPWTKEKNWGLDALVTQSILPHVKTCSILSDTFVCDVKTKDNLNKSSMWMKKLPTIDPSPFYEILSEEEKQILFSI